jgi:hypothetical protein
MVYVSECVCVCVCTCVFDGELYGQTHTCVQAYSMWRVYLTPSCSAAFVRKRACATLYMVRALPDSEVSLSRFPKWLSVTLVDPPQESVVGEHAGIPMRVLKRYTQGEDQVYELIGESGVVLAHSNMLAEFPVGFRVDVLT